MVWILTPDAIADIDRLTLDGAEQFGRAQAIKYEMDLVDRFDALAKHPYMRSMDYNCA